MTCVWAGWMTKSPATSPNGQSGAGMKRTNHYDVAFDAYLRRAGVPFVVVDEARRARLNQVSLKSLDFIVTAPGNRNLLVDVKGRQFPSGSSCGPARPARIAGESNSARIAGDSKPARIAGEPRRSGHLWENWATKDDLDSLLRWQEVFGDGFRAMLVFAYELVNARTDDEQTALPESHDAVRRGGVFPFRDRVYSFFGVWADEYKTAMHARSQSWETVSVPSREYRDLRIPVAELLGC
jgi:hypothetical protein